MINTIRGSIFQYPSGVAFTTIDVPRVLQSLLPFVHSFAPRESIKELGGDFRKVDEMVPCVHACVRAGWKCAGHPSSD